MKGLITLAKIWGVPIKIHLSFFILILIFIAVCFFKAIGINIILNFLFLVFILFLCVVMHELGHAFMAKKFDIKIKDIILSPIGGLTRMESMENDPKKEIIVSIAGPIINLLIAGILFIYLYFIRTAPWGFNLDQSTLNINLPSVLYFLFFVNLLLFGLNLIPAFPMDGGRILRAILNFYFPSLRATYIASVIGRLLAILGVTIGFIFKNYALVLVSLFIYIMALFEYQSLKQKLAKAQEE